MGHAVAVVVRLVRIVFVTVIVVDVTVRVTVHDPVGVRMRVRMRDARRVAFGAFGHAAIF